MAGLFNLETFHRTLVGVDVGSRQLCHRAASASDAGAPPLLLLTGGELGSRAVPFAIDVSADRVVLPQDATRGAGLIMLAATAGDGCTSFRSAVTNRFVSAVPGGMIQADRSAIAGWEQFRLRPAASPTGLATQVFDEFAKLAMACLSASLAWPDVLTSVLAMPPGDVPARFAEAVWPILTLAEFDAFAARLRRDARLAAQITALFRRDFYATAALPGMLRWLERGMDHKPSALDEIAGAPERHGWSLWRARPGAGIARPAPAELPSPAVGEGGVIGLERDHLARDGYGGEVMSLAHACNAALRLSVEPRRDVAIVATARSEGVYLLEWIAYHRLLGVESIFLYTNDNDDGSDALLAALAAAGVVTWTSSVLSPGVSAQNKAYGHALNVLLPILDFNWALFIDLDEFLVLDPVRYPNVQAFGRHHLLRQTDAVGINWTMVGSGGQLRWSEEPLTRRNTHLLGGPNAHIKAMIAPRHFIQAHPHFPFADPRRSFTFRMADGTLHLHRKQPLNNGHAAAFADEPSDADASLYHYYYKSVDEFLWKTIRNRGDMPMAQGTSFKHFEQGSIAQFISQREAADVRTSDRIARCAPGLDDEIERLRRLPGVRDAELAVIEQFKAKLADAKGALLRTNRLADFGDVGETLHALLFDAEPVG